MSDVLGPPADVTFTITITRKETGKQETYDMVGYILPEQPSTGETSCPQQ